MAEKISGESVVTSLVQLRPLVLLNEIPLSCGTREGLEGDYYWHDPEHTIIGFVFALKPADWVTVIYRGQDLMFREQVVVTIWQHVPKDTLFHVRTLEVVDRAE